MSIDRSPSVSGGIQLRQIIPSGVTSEIKLLKEEEFQRGKIEREQLRETMNRVAFSEQTIINAFSQDIDTEKEWANGLRVSIPLSQENKEKLVQLLFHFAVLFGYRYESNESKVDKGLELLQIETDSTGALLNLEISKKAPGLGFHVTRIDVIPPPVPVKAPTAPEVKPETK